MTPSRESLEKIAQILCSLGFSAPYINNLTNGDFAANMIDRMGAVGWWGSGSHYRTGGWGFHSSSYFCIPQFPIQSA